MFIWVFGIADDFPKDDKICCCYFAVVAGDVDLYICPTSELTMATFIHIWRKKRKHSSQSIAFLGAIIWLVGSFDVIE